MTLEDRTNIIQEWLREFEANKKEWPRGVTKGRLKKFRVAILSDTILQSDVIERHGGHKGVSFIKDFEPNVYRHCIGNIGARIREIVTL